MLARYRAVPRQWPVLFPARTRPHAGRRGAAQAGPAGPARCEAAVLAATAAWPGPVTVPRSMRASVSRDAVAVQDDVCRRWNVPELLRFSMLPGIATMSCYESIYPPLVLPLVLG